MFNLGVTSSSNAQDSGKLVPTQAVQEALAARKEQQSLSLTSQEEKEETMSREHNDANDEASATPDENAMDAEATRTKRQPSTSVDALAVVDQDEAR